MIIWMWVPLELVRDSLEVAMTNQPSTNTCSSLASRMVKVCGK